MSFKLKQLILLIISSLSLTFVSAQHNNSFVGIRFGEAFPLGEFASTDFETGGYALRGKSFGGEAAWFVNPWIGFGIDVSINTFGFDALPYAIDLKENTPEYSEAVRLLIFISYFDPIPEDEIPPTSVLREFLGGSSFVY